MTLEPDHNLLVATVLSNMPPRIQRFRLRLIRFNPHVVCVTGSEHSAADALSPAPVRKPQKKDIVLVEELEAFVLNTYR